MFSSIFSILGVPHRPLARLGLTPYMSTDIVNIDKISLVSNSQVNSVLLVPKSSSLRKKIQALYSLNECQFLLKRCTKT